MLEKKLLAYLDTRGIWIYNFILSDIDDIFLNFFFN